MIFLKSERLKSRKHVEELFKKGKFLNLHPLRMVYLPCHTLSTHQVLFTVSSKRVKKAVIRNKLKRRMREAYRLSKHCLQDGTGIYFLIGYIYTGLGQPCDFKTIQESIIASLHYINKLRAPNDHVSLQA